MNNDLISREALIKAVEDLYEYAELGEVLDVIKEAPTVTRERPILGVVTADGSIEFKEIKAERPHGKWIFEKANNEHTDGYICSICGRSYHTKVPYFSEYNFCPNCGADMREEANDETN